MCKLALVFLLITAPAYAEVTEREIDNLSKQLDKIEKKLDEINGNFAAYNREVAERMARMESQVQSLQETKRTILIYLMLPLIVLSIGASARTIWDISRRRCKT